MSARFGQNLRALRERAGLTQRALATRLGLTGSSTVSHWESGTMLPAPATVRTLARALGCAGPELLVGVVTPWEEIRGLKELPGPELLLSEDEIAIVRTIRGLDAVYKASLRDQVLPAYAAASAHPRDARRRRRRAS